MTFVLAEDGYTYWRGFDDPFFSGGAGGVDAAAVTKYDVVLAGRGYVLDWSVMGKDYFASIPLLRNMFLQDRGTIPIGEHSLNPSDYWRRSVDDWSGGAGQKALDHQTSKDNEFRISKGVDPWTIGELSLLNDTELSTAQDFSGAGVLQLLMASTVLYALSDSALYLGDTGTLTALTATGGDTALSNATEMAADGHTVWVADANRVHYTLRPSSTFTSYHTSDHPASRIWSAKGRLFTSIANVLYTHSGVAGSAVATAFYTHPNPDWTWTSVVGGPDAIYASGYSGDQSIIYATTIKSDGTDLDAPVAVATLPSGEVVNVMHFYLGVLLLGTSKGLRFSAVSTGGSIALMGLIRMDVPPTCFESQDRFVWFGWSGYDATSTGLGRVDLATLDAETDLFAYASDLMATASGNVTSVVTFGDERVFTVLGSGIYFESANRVPSGTIKSGWMNYALAENKIAIKFIAANRAGAGSYQLDIAVDDTTAQTVGNVIPTLSLAGNAETIVLPQLQGRSYEIGLTLNRDDTDLTASVVLDRWTLMVEPQPERRAQFVVPVLLHKQCMDRLNNTVFYEPADERRRFYELMVSRSPVVYQDRETSYTVIIDDFSWAPYENVGAARQQGSWDGTEFVTLKIIN